MGKKEDLSKPTSLELTSLEKCPYCDKNLDFGYIIRGGDIFWDSKKRSWPSLTAKKIMFPIVTVSPPNFPALRCADCGTIIFRARFVAWKD